MANENAQVYGAERSGQAGQGVPVVKTVAFDAPWTWLAKAQADIWKVPHVSLAYGAVFALTAFCLVLGLTQFGWQSLIMAMAAGFMIVGPLVAVGLYETSRRLQTGEEISLGDVVTVAKRAPGQIGFMGVVLMLIFFAWMQVAFLLFMLFLGGQGLPPVSEFMPTLLFTRSGLGLLIVGSLVGGALATLVFSITVVSVPMMLERKIDVVTAAAASVKAVQKNPKAMALWAILIAALMLAGIVTMFAGLIVVFPLIGHATWHAYKDLIESETTT